MEPTAPSDDFRLSIDWGDDGAGNDDAYLAAAVGRKRPIAGNARVETDTATDNAADSKPGPDPDTAGEGVVETAHAKTAGAEPSRHIAGWDDDALGALAADDDTNTAAPSPDQEPSRPVDEPPAEASEPTWSPSPPESAPQWPTPPTPPAQRRPAVDTAQSAPTTTDTSIDVVATRVGSIATRVEALHGEATRLRATTEQRLEESASQISGLVDVVSDLQIAIATIGDAGERISRLEEVLGGLAARVENQIDERFDIVAARQAESAEHLAELADRITEAQKTIDERMGEVITGATTKLEATAAETNLQIRGALQAEFELLVSRIRSSVDQAELGLRDTYDAGRREAALAREESRTLLADVANELRLVKRRLALRAKPPVAQLSDDQVDGLVRTVAAAVTAALTAVAAPSTSAALPPARASEGARQVRRPISARSTPVIEVVDDDDDLVAPPARRRRRNPA